ncbi:60S ribosomal protein L10a [Stylophora pistillata]|uniref:60S ribosomal protein L10a n=1 Tax=Stylophora pistillata TaxID=50429 RepID=A0A2B4RH90_STYPI|nr:60S ribosomal protein L10a [Stylophora pistillata]
MRPLSLRLLAEFSNMSKLHRDTLYECCGAVLQGAKDKKRKFTETVELQISLKNYDPQKDKRFSGTVKLKNIPRPKLKVCILGDASHCDEAKANDIPCMDAEALKKLNKNKKLVKKLGGQLETMLYIAVLNFFIALSYTIVDVSHLSLLPSIAKNQKEAFGLNALRTGFTFFIGVVIYLVTWVIFGQDRSKQLSSESSMDFTVITSILVGMALVFFLIFQTVTKEPTVNSALAKKFSNSVAELMRKTSFIPSNGVLQSMMYEVVQEARDRHQSKERMRDWFVESLKSKGEATVQATENCESRIRKRAFSMRFVDVLFSDEDEDKCKQESPSNNHTLTEKASTKRQEVEVYGESKPGIENEEEAFKKLSMLPPERKISLLVSVLDKLTDASGGNDQHLPDVPEEIKEIDVTVDENCQAVSPLSSNPERCSPLDKERMQETSLKNRKDSKEISPSTVTLGTANEGFDCNESELIEPCEHPVSTTMENMDEADDCKIKSGPLKIEDVESGCQSGKEMCVRAWLKNPHLYKVAVIYACSRVTQDLSYAYLPLFLTDTLKFGKEAMAYLPLVMLLSAIVSPGLSRKLVGNLGGKILFIIAALLVIGASLWFYFITPSTKVLTYPAGAILGLGFSTMFVNALSFGADLIGDNQGTSGFVFAFMGDTAYLMGGSVFAIVQNLFPEGSSSGDCPECGTYLRYVFSIVPGSFALISLLIALFFQSSKSTRH